MPAPLKFTEHALFRYCQRVLGADVAWLSDSLRGRLQGVEKDGHHKLKDCDAVAVVKEGFVVTIMTEGQSRLKRKESKKKWRLKEATEYY